MVETNNNIGNTAQTTGTYQVRTDKKQQLSVQPFIDVIDSALIKSNNLSLSKQDKKEIRAIIGSFLAKAGRSVRDWAIDAYDTVAGLFNKAEVAKQESEKAEAANDMGKSTQIKKNFLKQEIKMKNVDEMSDEAIQAEFKRIYHELSTQLKARNIDGFSAAKMDFAHEFEIHGNRATGSKSLRIVITDTLKLSNEGTAIFQEDLEAIVQAVSKEAFSMEGKEILEKSGTQDIALTAPDESIKQCAVKCSISANVIADIDKNIAKSGTIAAEIIQVATIKGYKLANFTQLAAIARGKEEVDVVATADVSQLSYLGRVKMLFNTLLEDVTKLLLANRVMNRESDEASAKIVAQKKGEEAEDIRKAQTKIEDLKKLIKKVLNTKLQNKLHADVVVISYLVQNPGEVKQALIDALRDDVKKVTLRLNNGH